VLLLSAGLALVFFFLGRR